MVYRRKAVQLSIESFGSGLSTPLSPDNEWVQLADQVPWPQLEEAYQLSFPSNLGRAGKPFRLLYGAQLIKQRTQLLDRELVAAIRDTPAYQYSIGLPEYQPQAQGGQLNQRQTQRLTIIRKLYEQQTEMYRQYTHRVADRIVSLDQPEIRPIIRGKAKDPVEFGPKIDVSISHGVVAVERFAFNVFNESADLPATIDHYFDMYGTYPDEILADTLYRTRANIGLCADLGIKLSGPRLGRRPKQVDPAKRKADRQAENRRGEIEREFAFIKGKLGLDLVTAKTSETIAVSIDAAIVLANLERLLALFSVPILFNVRSGKQTIKIEYQVTVVVPKSVASFTSHYVYLME